MSTPVWQSWTPTIVFPQGSSASFTYNIIHARYCLFGKMLYASFRPQFVNTDTSFTYFKFTLPHPTVSQFLGSGRDVSIHGYLMKCVASSDIGPHPLAIVQAYNLSGAFANNAQPVLNLLYEVP